MAPSVTLLALAAAVALSLLSSVRVVAQPAATTPLRGYNPAVWLGQWSGYAALAAATEHKHASCSGIGHSLPRSSNTTCAFLLICPLFCLFCCSTPLGRLQACTRRAAATSPSAAA